MEPEPQSTATENGGATQEALRKRWGLVKTILQECLEVPAVQRAGLLASRCEGDPALLREVRELLAASEASTGFLETPVFAGKLTIPDADAGMLPDGLIGPYRVISEIGRGGLGVVYRAVRDDGQYAQEVALKLVKRGMDTERVLSRFRLERQLLAFLNHPNIGRILDGGSTDDGRPYFVMELIDGVPISTYCETQGLDRLQRLQLFRRVCGAVEYAHRNLIVHRDLKPGNILVTPEGEPKLLDFGIAKLVLPDLDGDSVPETISTHLMTPDYASPEQVRGAHVDTTTDVYSLGAVLYELLTGRRAHQLAGRSLPEIHQVVCERDPIRPSAAVREGDAPHPTLRAR
jgi:eukaryotic-like serine/threonine-protein kinase